MPNQNAPSYSPALRALCLHPSLPACYLEGGERLAMANDYFEAQAALLFGLPLSAMAGGPLPRGGAAIAALVATVTTQVHPVFRRAAWRDTGGGTWDVHALPYVDEHGACAGVVLYFEPEPATDARRRLTEAALANAAEAVLLVEGDRVIPLNAAVQDVFGAAIAGESVSLTALRGGLRLVPDTAAPDPFEAALAGRALAPTFYRLAGPAGERHVQVRVTPMLSLAGARPTALVSAIDWTEPERERRRHAAGAARAEAVLGHISDGVLVVSATGDICHANPAAERILHLPPGADVSSLEALDVRDLEDRPVAVDQMPIARVLRGEHVSKIYLKLRSADQSRVVAVRGTPIRDERGGVSLGVLVLHDVTEPYRLRRALKEKVAELEHAMAAMRELDRLKTDFLNTMSHELRTPLSAIMGYAEFLEDGVAGEMSAQQREFLAHVSASARQLLTMIDDMLDFARLEAGKLHFTPSPIRLCLLVEELLPRFQPRAEAKRIRLGLDVREEVPTVRADHTRLLQVLCHLIDNALKFTPEGGTVTLTCAHRDDGEVEVSVADSGIGIPPEAMGQIFTKFFQVESGLRREQGGAGLGLAISKLLIEAQGGQIGLESHLGQGTRVWFTLPIWEEE